MLTEADKELFTVHLSRRMKAPPACPMCGINSWAMEGPMAAPHIHNGTVSHHEATSVVALVCKGCYFFLPFMWAAMVEASKITSPLPGENVHGLVPPAPQGYAPPPPGASRT